MGSIGTGASNGTKTLVSVAAIVGFGGVVQGVPGFEYLITGLESIPGPPLLQLAIATNVVAGIAGSASGGLGIALQTLAPRYLAMGLIGSHPQSFCGCLLWFGLHAARRMSSKSIEYRSIVA